MKTLFIGALVLLAGCAGQPQEVRTVRVDVPVQVPCRTSNVAAPAFAADGLK